MIQFINIFYNLMYHELLCELNKEKYIRYFVVYLNTFYLFLKGDNSLIMNRLIQLYIFILVIYEENKIFNGTQFCTS